MGKRMFTQQSTTDAKRARSGLRCAKCWQPEHDCERFQAGSSAVFCAAYCAPCWDSFNKFQGAFEEALAHKASEDSTCCSSCSGKAAESRTGAEGHLQLGKCCDMCPVSHGPLCPNIRCGACFKMNNCPILENGEMAFFPGGRSVSGAYYCRTCWNRFNQAHEIDEEDAKTSKQNENSPDYKKS